MKRLIENKLLQWKNKKNKMPLLVYGARQVGKTYTIYNFGKENYSNCVYLNFEGNTTLQHIFESDLNPTRIIRELESLSAQRISPKTTLLFFDEIQACEKALTSLKYFCENAPEFDVVAAGSLLGVAVNGKNFSFPVGKVEILTMYPMSFEEFLNSANEMLLEGIKRGFEKDEPLSIPIHQAALTLYKTYLVVGGMPKAVLEYTNKKDFDFVRVAQQEIHDNYSSDMVKYATKTEAMKIKEVYDSIPFQLAKENKKFQYALVKSNARAASYEIGLSWLSAAGVVLKCDKVNEGKMPLAFYRDALSYKIYMSDVGLLTAKSNMSAALLLSGENIGGEAKGAITENYVAQQLTSNGHTLYYWESKGEAELDFVLQKDDKIIPIEVKSADNVRAKSLGQFVKKYGIDYSIRISSKNFGFENNIKSVPLYAVFCI